jgi:F-box protein 9
MELLSYILKWIVSNDLDIHSLEQVSHVCRGFYLCARDEELWRLVCTKIWGKNCGRPTSFGSYREMYINRPHLRFNGCYISKSSYFRDGEKSLDQCYRPYHIVEYFRYIRFFPEGQVLMLTTPDNPYTAIPNLRSRASVVQGLMIGYYKLLGDRVTLTLKRKPVANNDYMSSMYRYRRQKVAAQNNNNDSEQSFRVELIVKSVGGKPHWQLTWAHYTMHTLCRASGEEMVLDFPLNNSSYPHLLFSRVRSFTAVSDKPLK